MIAYVVILTLGMQFLLKSNRAMVKIYTKTGDGGTTSLFGGERVEKNAVRIRAYGEVDELNSWIGVILSEDSFRPFGNQNFKTKRGADLKVVLTAEIAKKLYRIQSELFILGSDLATPTDVKVKIPRIKKGVITKLEKEIDQWSRVLPELRNFILPGGGKIRSKLHLARTVARRAERSVAELAKEEKLNKNAQIYINRLSDWLFTLARYVNKLEGGKEIIWKGRK